MAGARRLLFLLLALAASGLVSGCGKKGPLIPPEALVPAPISDLAVTQKGERFEVKWSAPSKLESGARLTDLAGFLLFRRPVLPPAEDCEECPTAYGELAKIELDYPRNVRRIGNSFLFDDLDLSKGKTYQYKVRSFTAGGVQSKDSTRARRTAVTPPAPPVLEVLPAATGVVLAFAAAPPTEGSLVGYNIYRFKEGAEMPLAPLVSASSACTTYEDKEVLIGTRYSYYVTAVAKVNGETVESDRSPVVSGAISGRD